ncbi:MAG TPA: iron-containing redox enzyme family protein [Usitatibacter sp.]|jgi:pyrroloquinoline quinone (PQQ) biosynthesis protein C|nr:iron-containing redox enzyme family protein [Usitatibacter sp.]
MDAIAALKRRFEHVMGEFNASPALRMLAEGRANLAHYKSILREIFHYSREDPQIQALAAVRFRGADREFVKMFLKHATMEIGHDRMALDDLAALGEDVSAIPSGNPLPSTMALIAFPFYQIEHRDAVGYLGYLYFLEFMPTAHGSRYGEALARLGVPAKAMTFLAEHVAVDVAHNKMMEHYLAHLVHDEEGLESVLYALEVTAQLYAQMLWGAIQQAERPRDYGRARAEAVVAAPTATKAALPVY